MGQDVFKFRCPHCQGKIGGTKDFIGLEIACPHCSGRIIVPEVGASYAVLPPTQTMPDPPFIVSAGGESPAEVEAAPAEVAAVEDASAERTMVAMPEAPSIEVVPPEEQEAGAAEVLPAGEEPPEDATPLVEAAPPEDLPPADQEVFEAAPAPAEGETIPESHELHNTQYISAEQEGVETSVEPEAAASAVRPLRLVREELQYLAGTNTALWNKLAYLLLEHSWEFAVTGELMLAYLEPLRQAVFVPRQQLFADCRPRDYPAYIPVLVDMEQRLAQILAGAHEAINTQSLPVLFGNDAYQIGGFCGQLGASFEAMRELHEYIVSQALPEQSPFTEAHVIASGWAPYVWHQFNTWAQRLKNHSPQPRDVAGDTMPQITIVPVNYGEFLGYLDQLRAPPA